MPIKRWNGSSHVTQEVKRWNGTAWVKQIVKRWDGSAWVTVSETPEPTVYTWEKWNVIDTATPTSYADVADGASEIDPIDSTSTWRLATSYSFDTSTGTYTVSGDESAIFNGGGYAVNGSTLSEYVVTVDPGNPSVYNVTEAVHTATPDSYSHVYTKGTTQYTDVTSENPSAYPANGTPDNTYWYVAK